MESDTRARTFLALAALLQAAAGAYWIVFELREEAVGELAMLRVGVLLGAATLVVSVALAARRRWAWVASLFGDAFWLTAGVVLALSSAHVRAGGMPSPALLYPPAALLAFPLLVYGRSAVRN